MANKVTPSKQITKPVAQPLAGREEVPAYLRRAENAPPAGLENMERGDMVLPRLGLCQSNSPQRSKQNPKFISGIAEGNYFNSVTRQNYGERVRLVPLLFYKSRILFRPYEEKGGILCQAQDAKMGTGNPGGECFKCPKSMFSKDGEAPECNIFFNYAALVLPERGLPGADGLVVFSLKSTGLKAAREWNSIIRLKNTDIFAGVYELTSTEQSNDIGHWYQPVIAPAGWVAQELYKMAKDAYLSVREVHARGGLKFDTEDLGPGSAQGPEEEVNEETTQAGRAPF